MRFLVHRHPELQFSRAVVKCEPDIEYVKGKSLTLFECFRLLSHEHTARNIL